MSRWTPKLLALATDPKISAKRYGFHRDRQGGMTYAIASPWGESEVTPWHSCVSFVFELLILGHRMLARDADKEWPEPTRSEWKLAFLWKGEDKRGPVLMAYQRGIATKPVKAFADGIRDGAVYVCQGHHVGADGKIGTDDDGGHCFFALAQGGGLVYLEANGKRRGGSVLGGLDGPGSRQAKPRCSRDWPAGELPEDVTPVSVKSVRDTYALLWTARLL